MPNAERINQIMLDCFFTEEELDGLEPGKAPKDAVIVPALLQSFGFHPGRLKGHEAEIAAFIEELAPAFFKDSGGGWSFLNMCEDKDGTQWGQHRDCEELYALAAGLGRAGFCAPREMWRVLPGGVPYIWFTHEPVKEEKP